MHVQTFSVQASSLLTGSHLINPDAFLEEIISTGQSIASSSSRIPLSLQTSLLQLPLLDGKGMNGTRYNLV